jgi:hypothetical protein
MAVAGAKITCNTPLSNSQARLLVGQERESVYWRRHYVVAFSYAVPEMCSHPVPTSHNSLA